MIPEIYIRIQYILLKLSWFSLAGPLPVGLVRFLSIQVTQIPRISIKLKLDYSTLCLSGNEIKLKIN
jgi:hypothetical protein